jgi:lipopolysaccharide transport system permease protein
VPWTFFANAVTASGNSLIGSAHLISKVYFPRLIVPLASVGAALVDFAIAAGVLLLLMAWYGIGWGPNLLLAPLLVLGVVFTALGVGTLLSALIIAYRDFRYVLPFMLQLWLFATPVVYPASLVPDDWRWLLYLNPMAGMVDGFRSVFLGQPFDPLALVISLGVAGGLFVIGVAYFEKVERRFADII